MAEGRNVEVFSKMPLPKKIFCTLGVAAGLVLPGCTLQEGNRTQKSPTKIPESLGGTLTQTLKPSETTTASPTETKTQTPTPENQFAQLVDFFNTSESKIPKEAADTINTLTSGCRTELYPLKPEDKKPYFPELTGLSIEGSEVLNLKEENTTLKFGYCNTEMYGNQETPEKALAPILVVYVGEGDNEKPVFLPTLEIKPADLTPAMLKEVSNHLKEGESIEFVRLVPEVSPDGEIIWTDPSLGVTVSSDGSLHLSQNGQELPANTEKQDDLVPMVVAVKQGDGTIRCEIFDPVQGRMPEDEVFNIQAGADGSFAGFEVSSWQNTATEVIEGRQFYNVFHIIKDDGTEELLSARAGKTPEEALADPYSQLAQAKINDEGKWIWERLTPPPLDWTDATKYASQDCVVSGRDQDQVFPEEARKLEIEFGLNVPLDEGMHAPFNVKDMKVVYIKNPGCYMIGFQLMDNRFVLLYRSKYGSLVVLPVTGLH